MVELNLNHIYKKYPSVSHHVVEDFDLDIKDKESIVLAGPSGCGKSITLRMATGFEDIIEGELKIDGEAASDKVPKDRDIATVFQNYALYPYITVYNNMAFGLKPRKYKRDDIDKRVREVTEVLGLTEFPQRKPTGLSSGRRQRVVIERVIARDAKVFLMDEPLSNLGARLRVPMRAETVKIHRRIGSITIYVTHDQTEVMTLVDRIVIMSSTKNPDGPGIIGRAEQIGTPQELYNRPANKFVAGFIGSPVMNFFEATVEGDTLINDVGLKITLPEGQKKLLETKGCNGKKAIPGICSEDVSSSPLVCGTYPGATIKAEVTVSKLLSAETMLYIKSGDVELVSRTDARGTYEPGEQVELTLNVAKGHFFDLETEVAIR